jgi:hypothetical protein
MGRIRLEKVDGKSNPVEVATKRHSAASASQALAVDGIRVLRRAHVA